MWLLQQRVGLHTDDRADNLQLAAAAADNAVGDDLRGNGDADNDGITQSPTNEAEEEEEEVADGLDMGNGWVAYKGDKRHIYYYNVETGKTQWDQPDTAFLLKLD